MSPDSSLCDIVKAAVVEAGYHSCEMVGVMTGEHFKDGACLIFYTEQPGAVDPDRVGQEIVRNLLLDISKKTGEPFAVLAGRMEDDANSLFDDTFWRPAAVRTRNALAKMCRDDERAAERAAEREREEAELARKVIPLPEMLLTKIHKPTGGDADIIEFPRGKHV